MSTAVTPSPRGRASACRRRRCVVRARPRRSCSAHAGFALRDFGGWAAVRAWWPSLAQIGVDFAVAAIRLRVGLGISLGRVFLAGFEMGLSRRCTPHAGRHPRRRWSAADSPLGRCRRGCRLLRSFPYSRASATGRIENARALHRMAEESEARLQSIVQNSSDLIAILDADGVIRSLTGAAERCSARIAKRRSAVSLHDWAHADDAPLLSRLLTRVAARRPAVPARGGMAHPPQPMVGYTYVETIAMNLLADERIHGIVLTARDIDARRAFEEQLRRRAFHDPLTQLANRALFYDRIEHALARDARDDVAGRRSLRRPRRLQGDQRRHGPRCWRRTARRRRRPPARLPSLGRHGRTSRRRRVRGPARTGGRTRTR